MRLQLRSAATLACVSLFASAAASAQDAGAASAAHEEAAAAFHAGEAAYAAGRFPEALTYFERAYELTEEPDVLYNIATLQDRLRRDADALASYRAYLDAVPDTDARANIEARVRVLEEAIASHEEPAPLVEPAPEPEEPEVVTPPPAHPESSDPGAGPWALVGVGAAAAVAGGVLLGVMAGDLSAVENASGVPWADVRDAYDRVPILSTAGFVALGVGVAVIAVGVVWVVAASGDGSEVAVGPGGIQWRGRF